MLTITHYPNGGVRIDAPLDRMAVAAPTLAEAYFEMTEALRAKRRTRAAHLYLVRHSSVGYDPRQGLYAAECPAAGVKATGHTRQEAWFRLLHGIEIRAEQMAREAQEENEQEDQVRGRTGGLDSGPDSGGAVVPGGEPDPEVR